MNMKSWKLKWSEATMVNDSDESVERYLFRKLVNIKQDDMKKVFHFNANEKKTQKIFKFNYAIIT